MKSIQTCKQREKKKRVKGTRRVRSAGWRKTVQAVVGAAEERWWDRRSTWAFPKLTQKHRLTDPQSAEDPKRERDEQKRTTA